MVDNNVAATTNLLKHIKNSTSRPTSESSSKELHLGGTLNQAWTRPDLDLTSPELHSKSPSKSISKSPSKSPLNTLLKTP